MKVPFVDLVVQYEKLKTEIDEAISNCLRTGVFIGGKPVEAFEQSFAKWNDRRYCISCANGSDAIELVLKATGIGEGDEVIVPALTWMSTATSVVQVGATPVFADIDPNYYTLDIDDLKRKITSRTKAILPVHLYGLIAPMDKLMDICKSYDLTLIEDCAQAHGATFNGEKAGTFGQAATFSFYPSKNLGAYGDAGAIITSNEELSEKLRVLANVGQVSKNVHTEIGMCSRMDSLQAAVLSVKLKYLDHWIQSRNRLGLRYNELLQDYDLQLPSWQNNSFHAFQLYVIQTENRDSILKGMLDAGIQCQLHYPKALVDIDPLRRFTVNQEFPVAREVVNRILSLPMFPELTFDQQEYVVGTLSDLLDSQSK